MVTPANTTSTWLRHGRTRGGPGSHPGPAAPRRRLRPVAGHLRRRRPRPGRAGHDLGGGQGPRAPPEAPTVIVAYVPDLMDRSKVAAAGDVRFVTRLADLADTAAPGDLVVVDLTRPGVVDVLGDLGANRVT